MAQEEKQARYEGMPRSAIDTGLVDFILPVEKMPGELMKYTKHPYIEGPKRVGTVEEQFRSYLQHIFLLIRSTVGHDFSNYKQNTIRRRIERRMAVHQIDRIADYHKYLRQNPAEVETLYKDMLITVTNFFRDADAFKALQKEGIMNLLHHREDDSPLRIWTPGCATGEEAYSLAMLFVESMEKVKKHINVQIFAADVSPECLHRFFRKENSSYKLRKQIREMVVFAVQNLIKASPFSKLNLVSCRNVLIYMDTILQKKIIPLFHYTLNPEGFLLLGTSESTGEFLDLFSPVDAKWKIFKRKTGIIEGGLEHPGVRLITATDDLRLVG